MVAECPGCPLAEALYSPPFQDSVGGSRSTTASQGMSVLYGCLSQPFVNSVPIHRGKGLDIHIFREERKPQRSSFIAAIFREATCWCRSLFGWDNHAHAVRMGYAVSFCWPNCQCLSGSSLNHTKSKHIERSLPVSSSLLQTGSRQLSHR